MKKVLLSAAIVAISFGASAQIKNDRGTFTKPTAGEWAMEVNFSPDVTGGGSIFSLSSFDKSVGQLAVKARKFASDKKSYRALANLKVKNSGAEGANTAMELGVGLGIENHMKGAERLSTYWGYQGQLGYSNDEAKTTKFGFAAGVFTGFDYYVIPNVYLGAEVSYSLGVTNTKYDGASKGTTSFELSPGITPTFRLGWRF